MLKSSLSSCTSVDKNHTAIVCDMNWFKLPYLQIALQLVLANPGPVVIDKIHASHVANLIGEDRIFLTVAEAVSSCSPKLVEEA